MASIRNNQAVGLKQNVWKWWKWWLLLSHAIQGSTLDGHLSMFKVSGRDVSEEWCFKIKFRQMFPGQLGSDRESFLWYAPSALLVGSKIKMEETKEGFLSLT